MKTLVYIGGRSNYGRLYQLIQELIKEPGIMINIILSGSATRLKIPKEIEELVVQRIECDMYEDTKTGVAITASLIITQVTNFLYNNSYDLAICHGDRYETLGFALACSYSGVKLVHMEAGEYSGNTDNKIRWAISSLADYQMAPTIKSHNNLLALELMNPYLVGSPVAEYILKTDLSANIFVDKYILVVYNPTDSNELKELVAFIKYLIAKNYKVVCMQPNTDPGNNEITKTIRSINGVAFIENLDMKTYLIYMKHCICIVGNTSSGIKEAAVLGKYYLMLPNRQQNREHEDNVLICDNYHTLCTTFCTIKNKSHTYKGTFGFTRVSQNVKEILEKEVDKND